MDRGVVGLDSVPGLPIESPVIAVVADRGAGKSTLLRQWQLQLRDLDGRSSAWLDQTDFAELPQLLDRLRGIHREPEPTSVFIDDFQTLRDPEARSSALNLVGQSPHQLVLASQSGADLPLHRWRASGLVAEFGTAHLQLGALAIGQLAVERGLEITPAVIERIRDRTHGFAGAIASVLDQFVQDRPSDEDEAIETAVERYAADLIHYVERSVPRPVFKFLAATSILKTLDRPLGSAVAGLSNDELDTSGIDLMAELRQAPFVEPADRTGRAVTVHPLARLGLQLRLRELNSESEIVSRHLAAAEGLVGLGQHREAVDHYLHAGEPLLAADALLTLWTLDPSKVQDEDIQRVSVAGAEDYVPHMVTQAFGRLRANEFGAARVLREQLASRSWSSPLTDKLESLDRAIVEIDGHLPALSVEHMERYIQLMAEESADGGGPHLPTRMYTVAHYHYWLGQTAKARECADALLVGHRSVGREKLSEQLITVLASNLMGVLNSDQGDTRKASQDIVRSEELLAQYGIDDLGAISEPALNVHLMARAIAGGGLVDERLAVLDHLIENAWAHQIQAHAWIERVRLLDRVHRFDDALESLAGLDSFVADSDTPPVPLHVERLAALQEALRPAQAGSGPAMHITAGERAVLYLLADHGLSQNDIAERLGLSINTVKSHLRSVYQKLGVTGRKDAVAEARTRRLLVTVDPWLVDPWLA